VTDIHSAKEDEIEATPDVGLVLIDPNDKAYLAITGRACVMRDADKIKAAWRKTDEVWWPVARTIPTCVYCGSSLPPRNGGMDRRALSLRPSKARLTGKEPSPGENCKVTVKM
jgi:hypothetical protein